MKLSELVAWRNQLNEMIESAVLQKQTTHYESQLRYLLDPKTDNFAESIATVNQQLIALNQQVGNVEQSLAQLKQQVDQQINQDGHRWFLESYKLYHQSLRTDSVEVILNRREQYLPDVQSQFLSRLKNYTDWRFPGMIVRPGLETFVDSMVANDPLYLVDTHYDLLTPAIKRFPEAYQRRLRPYVVKEYLAEPILNKIPDAQFGLCLVYNFFNFRPMESIRQWLTELLTKLRTGGVLIMTINDCDHPHGVDLVERNFACYTPGHLIIELARSIGYELLHVYNSGTALTWIELKKPGELTTVKGGQTLAKIVEKPIA